MNFRIRLFQVNISMITVVRKANFGRGPRVYRAILARARAYFSRSFVTTLAILLIQGFALFY